MRACKFCRFFFFFKSDCSPSGKLTPARGECRLNPVAVVKNGAGLEWCGQFEAEPSLEAPWVRCQSTRREFKEEM